jgi:hypothetical protein
MFALPQSLVREARFPLRNSKRSRQRAYNEGARLPQREKPKWALTAWSAVTFDAAMARHELSETGFARWIGVNGAPVVGQFAAPAVGF